MSGKKKPTQRLSGKIAMKKNLRRLLSDNEVSDNKFD
ncbi:hypothetical protein SAMN04489761_0861 [Tenacibaculum sp. MAR_2009_124]|nr:hypothetical protein SAMN04489761_0861 [Tenacibaculum sp. MAR_2009_124]